jgi:hypothetical protein
LQRALRLSPDHAELRLRIERRHRGVEQ